MDLHHPTDSAVQFVHRIGLIHFAHLRATAEGVGVMESARRYLGIDHGHQAVTAHKQTVEAVRSIARRRGESAWRLIGLLIAAPVSAVSLPSLDEFVAARDLDGWSEDEVAEMYAEAYPQDTKAERRSRLRVRQLDLLRRLEAVAAERPDPSDLVSGWFDDVTAKRLHGAGIDTLGQLHERIHAGGRWFSTMPGIGALKAERIAMFLDHLLPGLPRPAKVFFPLADRPDGVRMDDRGVGHGAVAPTVFEGLETGFIAPALISAGSDLEAVEAWIAARAGSVATAKSYRREAQRLLLWLRHDRGGRSFAQMDVDDCSRYQQFLADVPLHWISRARCAPGSPGWAPFRGKLSVESRKQALLIVGALFSWLQSVRYFSVNPWVLVNTKIGDAPERRVLESKAFSEAAMQGFLGFLDEQPPCPSSDRMRFILRFVEAVGLRSSELLGAKLADLQLEPEGWVLHVHGKGAKNRVANVPAQAYEALQVYLARRGLGSVQTALPDLPLVASVLDPAAGVGYQALYESVRAWVSKFVAASDLPSVERLKLARASMHWLRHSFGTRSIARGVPLDVIQAQMGHASMDTTASIYGRAPLQRRSDELGKAFGGG
jgi:site-specific recombinase XerD